MQLIHAPLGSPNLGLSERAIRVDRQKLSKRLWRGVAEDGQEFGFELERPLKDGETVWETAAARYCVRQEPEPVLEVSLDLPASAAAGIGWAIGNLHLELSAEATRLLAPDDPAVRQLLERLGIAYRESTAVFRPGRFVRGAQAASLPEIQELGGSHRH